MTSLKIFGLGRLSRRIWGEICTDENAGYKLSRLCPEWDWLIVGKHSKRSGFPFPFPLWGEGFGFLVRFCFFGLLLICKWLPSLQPFMLGWLSLARMFFECFGTEIVFNKWLACHTGIIKVLSNRRIFTGECFMLCLFFQYFGLLTSEIFDISKVLET